MKTATIRMLGKGLTALCLMLWSYAGFSQAGTAVFYEVKNMVQTSPSEFQYEVWCTNTGTTGLSIRGYSWGLNTAVGLNQSAYLTQNFVSRDAVFTGSGVPAVNPTPSASVTASPAFPSATSAAHLRGTTTNDPGTGVAILPGVPVRLATMRINRVTTANGTVANPWTGTNINPFINLNPTGFQGVIQVVTGAGRTQCVATMVVTPPGTSYAVNGTANAAAAGTLQALTAAMTPSPTGPTPFLLNAPTACTTPVIMPTQTASACGSYTWSVNGTTYNSTGLYTHTVSPGAPNCDTIYTLDLTITPITSNSTTASACDSYTWSYNIVRFNISVTQLAVAPVYIPEAVYVVPFHVYESQAEAVVVFVELGVMVKFNISVTQLAVAPVYIPEAVYVVPFHVYESQAEAVVVFVELGVIVRFNVSV